METQDMTPAPVLDPGIFNLGPGPANFSWLRLWEQEVAIEASDAPIVEFTDRSLKDPIFHPDPSGQHLIAWGFLLGGSNDSGIGVIRRNAAGQVNGTWLLPTPGGVKLDGLGGEQSGAHFVFIAVGHEPISSSTRKNTVDLAVLQNVLVPYPDGARAFGGVVPIETLTGAPAPPPAPGGEVTVAPDSVNAIARKALELIQASFTSVDTHDLGKIVQKLAKNGDNEALADHPQLPAFLADQNALLAVLENGLYQWAKDRAYEGDVAAEAGEPKTGTTAGPTGEHTNAQEIAGQ